MEPTDYLFRYLEAAYLHEHPDLTEGARSMLRDQIAARPEHYATTDHARALVSYTNLHTRLHRELVRMDEVSDEQFETGIIRLFDAMQQDVRRICQANELCFDARLLDILLTDAPIDERMPRLLELEREARTHLESALPGFDGAADPCWAGVVDADVPEAPAPTDSAAPAAHTAPDAQAQPNATAAAAPDGAHVTSTPQAPGPNASTAPGDVDLHLPELVGWLHTVEALSHECMASARYRAAAHYARILHHTPGYRNLAVGTLLLCLARLEDERGFFDVAREAGPEIEETPWFLLGRTLLLYKLDRMRSATRALREFAARCDGGAFFLLNPTYHDPYLPCRPPAREAWELSHQAVWEADAIIVDTPDFTAWASGVEGVQDAVRRFASRRGF